MKPAAGPLSPRYSCIRLAVAPILKPPGGGADAMRQRTLHRRALGLGARRDGGGSGATWPALLAGPRASAAAWSGW